MRINFMNVKCFAISLARQFYWYLFLMFACCLCVCFVSWSLFVVRCVVFVCCLVVSVFAGCHGYLLFGVACCLLLVVGVLSVLFFLAFSGTPVKSSFI